MILNFELICFTSWSAQLFRVEKIYRYCLFDYFCSFDYSLGFDRLNYHWVHNRAHIHEVKYNWHSLEILSWTSRQVIRFKFEALVFEMT